MDRRVHGDTIAALLEERRKTEKNAKDLQEQIDCLRAEREALILGNSDSENETLAALDAELEKLILEKRDSSRKLKNICMMARTISAGD